MTENMSEDLSLPISAINRIVSDALPADTYVSAETRKAIAKAASVFVLYATACAAGQAAKRNRKTTTAYDVLEGIEDMELTQFLPKLQESLQIYKQNVKAKKPAKKKTEVLESSAATEDVTEINAESAEVITVQDESD